MSKIKYPFKKDLREVVLYTKETIRNYQKPVKGKPRCLDLTIGHDPKTGDWGYQTGDNSFTGAAYCYQNWAVVTVYLTSNVPSVIEDILDQLADLAES